MAGCLDVAFGAAQAQEAITARALRPASFSGVRGEVGFTDTDRGVQVSGAGLGLAAVCRKAEFSVRADRRGACQRVVRGLAG
jgi:hypothetical protein